MKGKTKKKLQGFGKIWVKNWQPKANGRPWDNRCLLAAFCSPHPATSTHSMKQDADSTLALTAHGKSRWSRAILSDRHLPRCRVLLKTAFASRRRRPPTKKAQHHRSMVQEMAKNSHVSRISSFIIVPVPCLTCGIGLCKLFF